MYTSREPDLRHLPGLVGAVQRNCDVSDARHAGDYGLCTFLLKMREYYRWESELPFARPLDREALGEWLDGRERLLGRLEESALEPLPLGDGLDPFEAEAANRTLVPRGLVYGAGHGRFGKPVFFLGQLARVEERAGLTLVVSSCEYARELAAAKRLALAGCDFETDTQAALERLARREEESMILHEIGEAMAGDLLGEGWNDVTRSLARTPAEPVARAVRDLLADCLSTLPGLIARPDRSALHFHFATYDAPRRQLFPQALEAYDAFVRDGTDDRLRDAVAEGRERWLATARGLLALDPAARERALAALPGVAP